MGIELKFVFSNLTLWKSKQENEKNEKESENVSPQDKMDIVHVYTNFTEASVNKQTILIKLL